VKTLQLLSAYILYDVVIINKVSKVEFMTNVFVLEFNGKTMAYDLNNDNLRIDENMTIKKIKGKTKYEMITNVI